MKRAHDTNGMSESATSVPSQSRRTGNRHPLALALVPLALLGITCGFSLVQRAAASISHSEKISDHFGAMTMEEAQKTATTLCTELTGSTAAVSDVTRQCAYSWKRQSMVREWNVLCDSSEGQYLVRINADTRRVYAINKMDANDDGQGSKSGALSTSSLHETMPVSRTLAEERALEYLRIVGVPSQGLKQMEFSSAHVQTDGAEETVPQWNFTYRRSVPGLGKRLLKVSINGETGGLEHVWNPVFAL